MCWMSAYVEHEFTDPYEYTTKNETLKVTKVIYADDGTYFQSSRKGAQKVLNAVAGFATATGIVVKPPKSYAFSNQEGNPLVICTCTESTIVRKSEKGKKVDHTFLKEKTYTELKELGDEDFYKHLGNIQNALGDTPTHATEMYDGSQATNLHEKIRQELIALKSRNVTPGGALQAIKTVIYRQILYPMTYANTTMWIWKKCKNW